MKNTTLGNAKGFFDEVLANNYHDFINTPSTFRTAINVATSLFHMCEWIYEFKIGEIEAKYSRSFQDSGDLWRFIEGRVPRAKYIRDLANASKHVKLTIKPSTSMTHIANTSIQVVGFGEGAYGVGRYSAPTVTMKDGSNDVCLDDCANDLFRFWDGLIKDLYH